MVQILDANKEDGKFRGKCLLGTDSSPITFQVISFIRVKDRNFTRQETMEHLIPLLVDTSMYRTCHDLLTPDSVYPSAWPALDTLQQLQLAHASCQKIRRLHAKQRDFF